MMIPVHTPFEIINGCPMKVTPSSLRWPLLRPKTCSILFNHVYIHMFLNLTATHMNIYTGGAQMHVNWQTPRTWHYVIHVISVIVPGSSYKKADDTVRLVNEKLLRTDLSCIRSQRRKAKHMDASGWKEEAEILHREVQGTVQGFISWSSNDFERVIP